MKELQLPGGVELMLMRAVRWGALGCVMLLVSGCLAARNGDEAGLSARSLAKPQPTAASETVSLLDGPDTSIAARQQMGDRYASMILDRSKQSTDKAAERRLNRVVRRLARHMEQASFAYQVHLLEDAKPNAFTSGGGHLFVTTGMMRTLKSEGQMAMVLAHEMAHNELAHVAKGVHGRTIAERAANFSAQVLDKKLGLTWLGSSFDFLVATGLNTYTREQEDEADLHGLTTIVAAGFDPYVAPRAVRELAQGAHETSEWHNFFNGKHPTSKMRIWRLNNLIKAHFYNIDVSSRRRSSDDYDKLMERYWAG
jgi:predicted Zn-dependent protease